MIEIVSIANVRQDALRVTRGYLGVVAFAAGLPLSVLQLLQAPHWIILPIYISAQFSLIPLTLFMRHFTRKALTIAICVSCLTGFGVLVFAIIVLNVATQAWSDLNFLLVIVMCAIEIALAIYCYYFSFLPIIAARRLMGTRILPGHALLTTLMKPLRAPPVWAQGLGVTWTKKRNAFYLKMTGVAALVAAFALFGKAALDIDYNEPLRWASILPALISLLPLPCGIWLLGRGTRLGVEVAAEALRNDMRAPILYLRSFVDDGRKIYGDDHAWKAVERLFYSSGLLARLGGESVEQVLAQTLGGTGPFIAIANPKETLPMLGAARARLTDETWQSAIVDWVQMAQLIVQVAGDTKWVRWELQTIMANASGSKLVLLFPPPHFTANVLRWEACNDIIGVSEWGPAFAALDRDRVIAVRFLENGRLLVVRDGYFRGIDYRLAIGIILGHSVGFEASADARQS